ncbi:Zip1p LALA0_S09e02168g [Lachancea lanzarotensis]|uniref:LALA0S09e02168g1_1 n=1 Tax=Lachancea lanzarotensis TaxID=1245769 RepID=A0A0C7N771_9SACH|nr:uncharacterized protein LALA0_S09e02168g [Lachancea lanzarotensis]CEP63773.1 LALA0S09e02168g1_1 [Lachancea lanzarotensis]
MSNLFRDNARSFKPRSNIFTKLRYRDSGQDSDASSDNASTVDWSGVAQNRSKLDMQDSRFLTTDTYVSVLNESTPLSKNRVQKEDLRTRNVRDIVEKGTSVKDSTGFNATTSSNDVLLEAFTNTQKICSSLKLELQRVKSENQHQSDTIGVYQNEVDKLRGKMTEHMNLLLALETKSSELQARKTTTEEQLAVLRSDYGRLVERVRHHREDSDLVKVQLDDIRQQHELCGSAMSEQMEELERWKKECGAEQLRNQNLTQELKASRENSSRIMEDVFRQMDSNINKVLTTLEGSIKTEAENNGYLVPNFEQFCNTLQSAVTQQLKEESRSVGEEVQFCLKKEFNNLEGTMKNQIEVNLAELLPPLDVSLIGDGIVKITGELQKLMSSESSHCSKELAVALHDSVKDVKVSLSGIQSKLQDYNNNVNHAGTYERKVDGLHERLQAIALQKSEAVSLIKTRDTEIEDLNNQILEKSNCIGKLEDEEKQLRATIAHNEQLLEVKDQESSRVTEELHMSRANCENKLSAQNEVLELMKIQCDSLRSDIDACNIARSDAERENMETKEHSKKINEQVHDLNVEIIQLKARELEFDEENKKLKTTVEQFNLDARENSNQVREYKRRVMELESENTSRASDVLENQDLIAVLEQQLKSARKAIGILEEEKSALMRSGEIEGKDSHQKKQQQQRRKRGLDNKVPQRPSVSLVAAELPADQHKLLQDDIFELSSSSNGGLEMTYPSPIAAKALPKPRKVLLAEESDPSETGSRSRKKRRVKN